MLSDAERAVLDTAPLRSMQTGQNSSVPENSLPQLGQVRWGCVLMVLSALHPKS